MKNIARFIPFISAILFILIASIQNKTLSDSRWSKLPPPPLPRRTSSSIISSIVNLPLGPFRSIISNILWYRIIFLQERGKFVELLTLTDLITKLELENPFVWEYHAANMAFNICSVMPKKEDKWQWIMNAIRFLRDEAVEYTPHSAKIYAYLGWIYEFKLGSNIDTNAYFYREIWKKLMEQFFPDGKFDIEYLKKNQTLIETLTNKYKLLPSIIMEIEEQYCKLDWRSPFSHAVYWYYTGIKATGNKYPLQCQRGIYQSLAALFKGGLYIKPQDILSVKPSCDILAACIKAFKETINCHKQNLSIKKAFTNFLLDASVMFYANGNKTKAIELLNMAKSYSPVETANITIEHIENIVNSILNSKKENYCETKNH